MSADDSLLELFHQELDAQLELLSGGMLALERGPSPEAVDALMRAAHSIKGAARIVQLNHVERLAHRLEDCFVAAGAGTLALDASKVDRLLAAQDVLVHLSRSRTSELVATIEAQADALRRATDDVAAMLAEGAPGAVAAAPAPSVAAPPAAAPEPSSEAEVPTVSPSTDPPRERSGTARARGTGTRMIMRGAPGGIWSVFCAELKDKIPHLVPEAPNAPPPPAEQVSRALDGIGGAARIVGLDGLSSLVRQMTGAIRRWGDADPAGREAARGAYDRALQILESLAAMDEGDGREWLVARRLELDALEQAFEASLAGRSAAEAPREVPVAPSARPPAAAPASAAAPAVAAEPARETASAKAVAVAPSVSAAVAPADRYVRITSDNLDRLMGLAGEALVQVNGLQLFADSLLHLKRQQVVLSDTLEGVRDALIDGVGPDELRPVVYKALERERDTRRLLSEHIGLLEDYARQFGNLSNRLYRAVIASRMRPFGDGVKAFSRMVRDLGRALDKKVNLVLEGVETEVDRDILDRLEAPLTHLLRNAVDHGVEMPEQRVATGKPAEARIVLEARHRAGSLAISITDDGRGLDLERIRAKGVERGLLGEHADSAGPGELIELIFKPGFSTAASVTEISGRGVGLDAVRNMVASVGGEVRAESQPGKGSRFTLELPLTLSVVRTMLVRIAGEPYAFPLTRIEQVLRIPLSDVYRVQGRSAVRWNGRHLGLVDLHQILEIESARTLPSELSLVLVGTGVESYALVVDSFLGEHDLVVRPLDRRLGKIPDIAAGALMEDGTLVLIVDVDDVLRSIARLLETKQLDALVFGATIGQGSGRARVLVVDDSITVREYHRQLLERNGYDVELAVDGKSAWAALGERSFDIVVTDVEMPGLDGFDLVRKIRAEPTLARVPTVLVTSRESAEDRRKGVDAGVDLYLVKRRFDDDSLVQAVRELAGRRA